MNLYRGLVDRRAARRMGAVSARGAAPACAALVCAALLCALALPAHALAREAAGPSFADAVTTTGPTPPPGVHPAVGVRSTLGTAGEVLLGDVPAYLWHDGCAPTSLGMVLGYYDSHGFPDLIPGDGTSQTANAAVNQAIASHGSASDPENWEDYALPQDTADEILQDRSELPGGDEHASDSVADFMQTSWSVDGLPYGWSYLEMVGPAYQDYVALVDPSVTATSTDYWYDASWGSSMTFAVLQAEIDAGRPMVFYVDCTGDGVCDHAVAAIGYRETSGYPEYAYWDTWDRTVQWSRFRGVSSSYKWGVCGGTAFTLSAAGEVTDLSRPVTKVAGVPAGWSAAPVTLTFTATDEGSGVAGIDASVDSPDLDPLDGLPASLQVTGQGAHTVRYRARDNRGNVEATHTCTVRIDAEGPTTTARPARVRKGARVNLRYEVDDVTPKALVKLVIRTPSGRTRATLRPGWRATGGLRRTVWRARLRRGVYRLCVYATDQAGNNQTRAGSARLVVR
ncbi:MAG TPA: hypothetical protein VMH50_01535 [Thermoleophilia bacterium]|nr:hypothetical protein [Thermoleophilia bacterium]